MFLNKSSFVGAVCLFALGSLPLPAFANPVSEADKTITFELNNAEALDGACRLSFLIRNGLDVAIKAMGVEIVILNKKGLAQDLMVLNTGALSEGKRRLRQFDLPGVPCSGLGEILINDVSECDAQGMTPAGCLAALSTESKVEIGLGL